MAEEIEDDSAVIDSWEDFDENPEYLDKQLTKMTVNSKNEDDKPRETVIVNEEEAQRCSTYNLQEPKIMILRRPQPNMEEVFNGSISQKQKVPLKTLQQRQAEYAEARLRILGNSGSSTELKKQDNMDDPFEEINATSVDPDSREETQAISVASGSAKPIILMKPSTNVSVIRSPRAPCGQPGFQDQTGNSRPS